MGESSSTRSIYVTWKRQVYENQLCSYLLSDWNLFACKQRKTPKEEISSISKNSFERFFYLSVWVGGKYLRIQGVQFLI